MPQRTCLFGRQLYTALLLLCILFRTLYQTFHDNWHLNYLPWMLYTVQGMSSRKHRCTLFVGGWISLFRGYFRGHHSTEKEILNWSKLKQNYKVVNKMDFCKNSNNKKKVIAYIQSMRFIELIISCLQREGFFQLNLCINISTTKIDWIFNEQISIIRCYLIPLNIK